MFDYLSQLNPMIAGVCIFILAIGIAIYKLTRKRKEGGETEDVHILEAKEASGQYKAFVWRQGFISFEKIDKPIGKMWYAAPSLPESGQCYLCMENEGGDLIPYDPREKPVAIADSPQDLYEVHNWRQDVDGVYINTSGLWEKISTLMPYVIAILMIIVLFMMVDKL